VAGRQASKRLNIDISRRGLAIAAAWGGLTTVCLLLQFGPLLAVQLRASDYLFMQEGGPFLGRDRSARSDIVLLIKPKATTNSGMTYSMAAAEEDLRLYEQLLDDGARAWSRTIGTSMRARRPLALRARRPLA